MSTIKLLTGKYIHETFNNHISRPPHEWREVRSWDEISEESQEAYNTIAKQSNQALGLCESCGERPVDPNGILQINGNRVCFDCRADESTPLQGAVVAQMGMTLGDIKKQLTEEAGHISFVLYYEDGNKKQSTCNTGAISELYDAINKYVIIPTENFHTSHSSYAIKILKNDQEIGCGTYSRTSTDIIIKSESGAAEGLNNALYEYAFNHL